MGVPAGLRIGPYEILAPLGAGGMGEVYRARDTKLGRDVAIKMLPEALAADAERVARLEREARLLATLNHPGIAHLYGFEVARLDGGRPRECLVMELVAGDDLAQRLARGPVPLDDTLEIARQIAEAFEEAHDRGIVHRDLKPANVKVTPEGKVKVLDFGLAKAYAGGPEGDGPPDMTQSPTLAQGGTMVGSLLGTAAYMAPEQVRGRPVDRRVDVWAFGVVVFEMLTGTRLFAGETVSDTLAAVLRHEIPWGTLPKSTPGGLRRLLVRCLERDPKRRLRDMGDARLIVEEIQSGADADPATPKEAGARVPPAGRGGRSWPIAAAFGAALALGIAAGWGLRRPAPSSSAATERWALAIPDGLTLSTVEFPQLALSEDGRTQVVVVVDKSSTTRLLVKRSDEFEARVLPDSERAVVPFVSPDGAWVGFFRDNGLFKMPLAGGPPIRLASGLGSIRGGTWSRDGHIYFPLDSGSPLFRVSADGGEMSQFTSLDDARDERTHRWPQVLPDGSAVLFTCDTRASTEYYDDARIEAVRPATGERKVLVEGSSQAWYSPSGHLVFARGGSLYAIRFDAEALTVRGSPVQVAQGVATDVGSGAVQFVVARSGTALWTPGGMTASYQVVWVDRNGKETAVPIPPAPYNELALSPDGRRLALNGGPGGVADLWVADLARGVVTHMTTGVHGVQSAVWTPDGARIVYHTSATGRDPKTGSMRDKSFIVSRASDGSRDAETLIECQRDCVPDGFTPDGRSLIYELTRPEGSGRDIWILPLGDPRGARPLLSDPYRKRQASFSPDGRWLAYTSNEGGDDNVFVRPFPTGDSRWQISTPSGVEPQWSRDGREIYYRNTAALYRVPVQTRPTFSAGRPERLFDRVASGSGSGTYSPSADGSRILTYRSTEGQGSLRTLYLDLGFAARLSSLEHGP